MYNSMHIHPHYCLGLWGNPSGNLWNGISYQTQFKIVINQRQYSFLVEWEEKKKKSKGCISIYFTSLVSTKTRQVLKDDCRWYHSTKPKHSCCTRCGIFVEPDGHGLGYMECSHWTGKYKKEDQKQKTVYIQTLVWGLYQLSHLLS